MPDVQYESVGGITGGTVKHMAAQYSHVLGALMDRAVSAVTGLSRMERLLTGTGVGDLLVSRATPSSSSVRNSSILSSMEDLIYSKGVMSVYDQTQSTESSAACVAAALGVRETLHPTLQKVIKQIRLAAASREAIQEVQTTTVSTAVPVHTEMLQRLWNALEPDSHAPGPPSASQWSDLGFNGTEPERDFRGVGMLGLAALLYFAERHTARAREVLRESRNADVGFPFCATGLNVCAWLVEQLEEGRLNVMFYTNPTPPLEVFHIGFSFFFLEFSRYWRVSRPTDIMQFGRVSAEFRHRMAETLKGLGDASGHSEWNLNDNTGEQLTQELQCWIEGEVHPHQTAPRCPGLVGV